MLQYIVRRLLACVYQATRNSGDVTRNAARAVAGALGAEYFEFDVDRVVEEYKGLVGRGIGRELEWKTDDVALQNIQARVRAPAVWMLANIRSALLLATSNRSEAAVGYAWSHAAPGDVVLLAPACASFDQFDNYEHRGRVFKQAVASLESAANEGSLQ